MIMSHRKPRLTLMVKCRESSQNTLELNTVANVWSQDKQSGVPFLNTKFTESVREDTSPVILQWEQQRHALLYVFLFILFVML